MLDLGKAQSLLAVQLGWVSQRYLHANDTRVSVVLAIRVHLRKHIINQLYLLTERMVIVCSIIVELVAIHRAGEV